MRLIGEGSVHPESLSLPCQDKASKRTGRGRHSPRITAQAFGFSKQYRFNLKMRVSCRLWRD